MNETKTKPKNLFYCYESGYFLIGMNFHVQNWTVKSSHNLDVMKMVYAGELYITKKLLSKQEHLIWWFRKCENENDVFMYYFI